MQKNPIILIVDDLPQNIELLEAYLMPHGYKIFTASSGVEALNTLIEHPVDLILLDVMMPNMDGFEVTRRVRLMDDLQLLPIILVTALRDTEERIKGIEAGCDDFISKPFDKNELLSRVRSLLKVKAYNDLKRNYQKELVLEVTKKIKELKHTNAKLNALYEQTNLGMSFINQIGEFIDVNEKFAELLGYSKDEMLKLNIIKLIHPDDFEETQKAFEKISKESLKYVEIEKKFLKKDASYIWFHVTLTGVGDSLDAENFYVASVCKDITEEVLLREELKSKEEMLITQSRHAAMGNMIGMIAHQWRQPLSAISIIASSIKINIALDIPIDNTMLSQSMDELQEQVMYSSQTIEDFKNYFKPNKEKISTMISDVMEKALHLINQSFISNNIEVQKNYNLKTEIKIFSNELIQVFINIINNAKDAIISNKIQNPKIMINVSEDDKNIVVTIADNAGGMPSEVITNIGNLYFTTKGSGGTGLGMYMSKTIIEKHLNGILKWENKDEGACFIVILPKE